MSNCIWPSLKKRTPCIKCGYPLPRDYDRPPVLECKPRNRSIPSNPTKTSTPPVNCIHLGNQLNSIKVKCGTNSSSFYPVYECKVHGRCVPTFGGPWSDDYKTEAGLYHLCGSHNCQEFRRNL